MAETRSKIWATVEVHLSFVLIVLLFRFIRGAAFSVWESDILPASRLLFLEYGVTLVVVLALLISTRRSLTRYGIAPQNYHRHFRVIAVGLLPMLMLGGVLGVVDWGKWPGALMVSVFEVILLIGVGWILREKGVSGGAIVAVGMISLIPWVWKGMGEGGLLGVVLKTVYYYLFAGPAEEVLFRGYIQTRLNEVYGKPYEFFGVKWGGGVVVASLLFGLWHVVLNPSNPQAWPHCLWTIFGGLVLGYFRERSGGILSSSILHSVMNYVPVLDLL